MRQDFLPTYTLVGHYDALLRAHAEKGLESRGPLRLECACPRPLSHVSLRHQGLKVSDSPHVACHRRLQGCVQRHERRCHQAFRVRPFSYDSVQCARDVNVALFFCSFSIPPVSDIFSLPMYSLRSEWNCYWESCACFISCCLLIETSSWTSVILDRK